MQPAALPAAEDRTVRIMPCMDIPPCNGVSSNVVKRIINYSILFCNAFKMNYHIELMLRGFQDIFETKCARHHERSIHCAGNYLVNKQIILVE